MIKGGKVSALLTGDLVKSSRLAPGIGRVLKAVIKNRAVKPWESL